MVIYGPNGVGKSHTAKAVSRWAKRTAIELPLVVGDDGSPKLSECHYVFWPSLCQQVKNDQEWSAFEDLIKCELLVLDDIGAEHDPSKWAAGQLYLILERREYRWTMITTNYGPDAWESKFDKRIASRFLRNSTLVSLEEAPDFNNT